MAKQLKANVWVDGVLYGPDGEKPNAEVSKQITNEKAWEDADDSVPPGPGAPGTEKDGGGSKAVKAADSKASQS